MAFALGAMATVGVMKVVDFFQPNAIAANEAITPVQNVESVEVTRTSPQTLLAVVEEVDPIPEPVVASAFVTPVARPERLNLEIPTSFEDIVSSSEAEALAIATTIGAYELIAEDFGTATRIALYYPDAEKTAIALRHRISLASDAGLLDDRYAHLADGAGVDSQTLLFGLIQTKLALGNADDVRASQVLRQKAFAASDARTELVEGSQVYVVRPGDSLAYIALQFYGSTRSAEQIFLTNKDVIGTPEALTTGMRLIIPSA